MAGMMQQMQMLQAASQLQATAAGALGGAVPGTPPPAAKSGWQCRPFASCMGDHGASVEEETNLDIKRDKTVDASPISENPVSLTLRVCVHGAEETPEVQSRVTYVLKPNTPAAKTVQGDYNSGEATKTPLFMWCFEEVVNFTSAYEELVFKLHGKAQFGDRLIGQGEIQLYPRPTLGPQRKVLPLSGDLAATFGACGNFKPTGKLTVVYELVETGPYFRVPLGLVAEMGPDICERAVWTVDATIHSLACKGPRDDATLRVEVLLYKPVDVLRPAQQAKSPWEVAKKEVPKEGEEGVSASQAKLVMNFGAGGWNAGKWRMQESKASLMGYILMINVYESKVPDDDLADKTAALLTSFTGLGSKMSSKSKSFGGSEKEKEATTEKLLATYREPLVDLLLATHGSVGRGRRLKYDAELLNLKESPAGHVRLELDMYDRHAHQVAEGEIPLRHSMPDEKHWSMPVQYYVAVYAEGLYMSEPGRGYINPWVRIIMGQEKAESPSEATKSGVVIWDNTLSLRSSVATRHANIQIYNNNRVIGKGADLLACEEVHDVQPGAEFWLHSYGGSPLATNQAKADEMARNLVKPASTYAGSLFVSFGYQRKIPTDFEARINKSKKLGKLVVRLHEGLYFRSMAQLTGKRVQVLVQVAGCAMLDHRGLEAQAKGEAIDPSWYNRNLLSFAGKVDNHGVLSFTDTSDQGTYAERSTPPELPFKVPPGLTHAYLYVVAVGEEKKPPTIFGCLMLDKDVHWAQMYHDESVVELPQSHFPCAFAGFILGSARIDYNVDTTTTATALPKAKEILPQGESWFCNVRTPLNVGSPGVLTTTGPKKVPRKIFCHIDILAARNLPQMDEEGICDPCYTIHVCDKVYHQPPGLTTTSDPNFLNRIVIPLEVYDTTSPLPPVVVRMHDQDKIRGMNQTVLSDIYTVIVPEPRILQGDSAGNLNLNVLHEARWYALNREGYAEFEPEKPGSCDQVWVDRPRLLMAVGYSEIEKVNGLEPPHHKTGFLDFSALQEKMGGAAAAGGYQIELQADRYESFQVEVNLLGLRLLPLDLQHPDFRIQGWWDGGAVSIEFEGGEGFPTFGPGRVRPDEYEDFEKRVSRALHMVDDTAPSTDRQVKSLAKYDDQGRVFVHISKLLGERIRGPIYRTPVLSYLLPTGVNEAFDASGRPRGLLMPTLTLSLKNKYSQSEYGVVAVPIEDLGDGAFQPVWAEVIAKEMTALEGKLPKEHLATVRMEETLERPDIYDVVVDCFTAKAGFVTIDPQVRMGRVLQDHLLFSIADHSGKPNSESFMQYLNPFDFVCGDPRFIDEPYDERMCPTLRCQPRDGKAPSDVKGRRPMFNDENARVALGDDRYVKDLKAWDGVGKWYCGRDMGEQAIPGSDGICGPHGGPQCPSCTRFQAATGAKVPKPAVNDDGAPVHLGDDRHSREWDGSGKYYCGRMLGEQAIPGSDGSCGPHGGPQCQSCLRFQAAKEDEAAAVPTTPGSPTNRKSGSSPGGALAAAAAGVGLDDDDDDEDHFVGPGIRPPPFHAPLPPKAVLSTYFAKGASLPTAKRAIPKAHHAEEMSTTQMTTLLQGEKWRVQSHLHAPEPEVPRGLRVMDLGKSMFSPNLEANTHTFIRPVGHIIDKQQDRDSVILARLRMDEPTAFPPDLAQKFGGREEMDKFSQKMVNFALFRFNAPGVVIWCAPESIDLFSRPGTPILLVEVLDGSGDVVAVTVPSFDLRFPVEQGWTVSKTLRHRSGTLRRKMGGMGAPMVVQEEATPKSKATSNGGKPGESAATGLPAVDKYTADQYGDGYASSVWVEKYGFVLRLRKTAGSRVFERMGTENWYRTIFGPIFPEMERECKEPDLDPAVDLQKVKKWANNRFMNVQLPIKVSATDDDATAKDSIVKGHITCHRVTDDGPPKEKQAVGKIVPVQQLWKRDKVKVSINILNVIDIPKPMVGKDFYLTVKLGNLELKQDAPTASSSALFENLYCQFDLEAELPGASPVEINLWMKGMLSPTLVGTAYLDIEERWFLIQGLKLRESSSEEHIRRSVSPAAPVYYKIPPNYTAATSGAKPKQLGDKKQACKWLDSRLYLVDAKGGTLIKPVRKPTERMPIETLELYGKDENFADARTGIMRVLVQYFPVTATVPKLAAGLQTFEFELRVTVNQVTNIQVFTDDGERNDCYVLARFCCKSRLGEDTGRVVQTDVHKFAVHEATFYWRWCFKVLAPTAECWMEFTLMDKDSITGDDKIYDPRVYPLDELVMAGVQAERQGKERLGVLQETVVFDSWEDPDGRTGCERACAACFRRSCPCIARKKLPNSQMRARLSVDFELIPKAEAEKHPVDDNVQIQAPTDRMSWQRMLQDPGRMTRVLVGPTRLKRLRCFCLCILPTLCCFLALLIILLVLYYAGQLVPIYMMLKGMNGGSAGTETSTTHTTTSTRSTTTLSTTTFTLTTTSTRTLTTTILTTTTRLVTTLASR